MAEGRWSQKFGIKAVWASRVQVGSRPYAHNEAADFAHSQPCAQCQSWTFYARLFIIFALQWKTHKNQFLASLTKLGLWISISNDSGCACPYLFTIFRFVFARASTYSWRTMILRCESKPRTDDLQMISIIVVSSPFVSKSACYQCHFLRTFSQRGQATNDNIHLQIHDVNLKLTMVMNIVLCVGQLKN